MEIRASHLGQGHIFKKMHNKFREWGAKNRRGMKYSVNCACDALADGCGAGVVPAVGPLEADIAPDTCQNKTFHEHMNGKRAEADGQRSNRSKQSEVNGSIYFRWGSK